MDGTPLAGPFAGTMTVTLEETVNALGPALGFFIGVICGLSVLLLLRVAVAGRTTLRTTTAEISQLLAIPTFSFGSPWATSQLLHGVDLDHMLPPYATALTLSFAAITGYPLARLIMSTAGRCSDNGTEQ
jgi:hypothetical protein